MEEFPVLEISNPQDTMRQFRPQRLRLLLVLGVLLGTACGCPSKPAKPAGRSVLTTTVAGREIRAVIEGPGFIHPAGNIVEVSTSSHKITVERERVLLDGTELAQLPVAATKVEVTVVAGTLTITADGTPVITQPLSP